VLPEKLDSFEDFLGAFCAETGQFGHFPLLAGLFQLFDRFDPKFLIEDLDLSGAQAGDLQQLQQTGGKLRPQLFVCLKPTGCDQFLNLLANALPDSFQPFEPAFSYKFPNRLGQGLHRSRCILVGPNFKGVFAFELQ